MIFWVFGGLFVDTLGGYWFVLIFLFCGMFCDKFFGIFYDKLCGIFCGIFWRVFCMIGWTVLFCEANLGDGIIFGAAIILGEPSPLGEPAGEPIALCESITLGEFGLVLYIIRFELELDIILFVSACC